jgi:hypothetical protein
LQSKYIQGKKMITGIVWLFTGVILGWIASSAMNTLKRSEPPAAVGPDRETLDKLEDATRQVADRNNQIKFLWMRVGQMARGDYRID